jgi:leucyl-tRNA synthetase
MDYNHIEVESKWSQRWVKEKIFTPDIERADNPYYALFMFPYPSAEGLHIGNFYAFTSIDVLAKYKKLKGFDVFQPFGFDAFGMHSENYALKINEKPREMLDRTENNFRRQLRESGIGCDWTREVNTTYSQYYKWNQWIFIQLFKKGLAFQKKALLNWCPDCKTVLADEQIENNECERCGAVPEKKEMKQWFFKITDYAERLLNELEEMNWSEITKSAQKNWIGKSEGALIKFKIVSDEFKNKKVDFIDVFTTRPDTLFGATYFILSPEHPFVNLILEDKEYQSRTENYEEICEYVSNSKRKSDLERMESKEKTGVFTNIYVVNPINNREIPVWIADYVLINYGTGAIMAVPAHDERDWEFASKYKLPMIQVLKGGDILKQAFVDDGEHINSDFLNGLEIKEAIDKSIEWLEEKNRGEKKINYKLRDWCISRQRYWGTPIPIIYCDKCGVVPVSEKDLPVILPDLEKDWEPAGNGKGPLAKVDSFINVKCPKCNEPAKRESDVMDNFLDSSWYFFRYLSWNNNNEIFDLSVSKKWLPVDIYIGGNEHAVLHLMYTRFITMVFKDLGLIDFTNPFKKFRANGMILKDGKKMSKSKGNVVNPEDYGKKIGYDALKSYLLFLGPLSDDKSFSDSGVLGTRRWIEKVFRLEKKVADIKEEEDISRKIDETIKKLENCFDDQKYNTAVAQLMEVTNFFSTKQELPKETWVKFLALIAPFAPALSEELWERTGKSESIFKSKNWPTVNDLPSKKEFNLIVQVNGKVRDNLIVSYNISEKEALEIAVSSLKVKKWTENKDFKKVIFVKNKLINIVI